MEQQQPMKHRESMLLLNPICYWLKQRKKENEDEMSFIDQICLLLKGTLEPGSAS